jgi:hypothetical protein
MAVERDEPLKYARIGQFTKPDSETFAYGAEIPNLGKATADSAINCESFLVTRCPMSLKVRSIKASAGVERFCVDQLLNPDSVTFTPAGLWDEQVVLHGRVATVSASGLSQELMKQFSSAFAKYFSKIKAFFVGTKALALLDAGKRLTISVQSPREFDLGK